MATTRLRFLDLSSVQTAHVDFDKVKADGYDAVVLKATEGSHYVDPTFDQNCHRAKVAGLIVGAYMFLTTGSAVSDQVALFVGTAVGKADFYALDFESPPPEQWAPPNTGEALTQRALDATNLLRQATGTRALILVYSYPYFVHSLPKTPTLTLLAEYPLWIASYKDEKHEPGDHDQPVVPLPWTTWLAWQWSGNNGSAAPGVPCVVDHNVANMTPAEFQVLVLKPLEEIDDEVTEPGVPPVT